MKERIIYVLLAVILMIFTSACATSPKVSTKIVCSNTEVPSSHLILESIKDRNVSGFLAAWDADVEPTATDAVQYLTPSGVTINQINFISACRLEDNQTISFYILQITGQDSLVYSLGAHVTTNDQGMVTSIE